jgi:3'-5' exoribonuclease
MRKLYLNQVQPGDILEDVFSVSNKQFSATSTNKNYIKCFVGDKTTTITARLWNATREIFTQMPESGFIRVRGRVENYQNNLQFIIEQIWPAKDGTYDPADLLPTTPKHIPTLKAKLTQILASLQNPDIIRLVAAFTSDTQLMANLEKAPAASTFHHAYIGGLLEHTVNTLEVASAIIPFYPGLSRDTCLAGIFLHDLAKTWELSYAGAFSYTDAGQLVGHVAKGAIWVQQKADALAAAGTPISPQLVDVMQHIILSHHGQPEFGAARVPSTPEAIFVHIVENMDAKLMMSLTVTRGDSAPPGEGNWTEYVKALGVRLYKPDAAPVDAASTAATPPTATPTEAKLTNPLFETQKRK